MSTESATCRHCQRTIVHTGEAGTFYTWVDPLATGDDSIWRETCDAHDTFVAEHEPERRQTLTTSDIRSAVELVTAVRDWLWQDDNADPDGDRVGRLNLALRFLGVERELAGGVFLFGEIPEAGEV